jgi:hypothetical protein
MHHLRFPAAAIAFSILAWGSGAYATKPCPQAPCHDASHRFNRSQCEQLADWVAEGRIAAVVHHPEGPPLSKDFAEFTFRITRFAKRAQGVGPEVRFRVGWCDNRQELPLNTTGVFRFFGLVSNPAAPGQPGYLYFEPLPNAPAQ